MIEWKWFYMVLDSSLYDSLTLRLCGLVRAHLLQSFWTIATHLHSLTSFRTCHARLYKERSGSRELKGRDEAVKVGFR